MRLSPHEADSEVQCSSTSTFTKSQPTMDINTGTTGDEKNINSVEDLERGLAESRRFVDEMREKLRGLIERNRKIGMGQ
ncbi:hypothetical protein KCU61_g8908, partial [Aureobasidium melanogenum]